VGQLEAILDEIEIKQSLDWYERRKGPPTLENNRGSWRLFTGLE